MGRLAPATAERSPNCCSPPSPAASARWVRSSTPPPTTCAGQGANIRDTIIKLSQAFSALGDHSTDIFSTIKNLSTLVSALQDSTDLMRQLNQNLAVGHRRCSPTIRTKSADAVSRSQRRS